MWQFEALQEEMKARGIKLKVDNYIVTAAKASNEEDYELIKAYYKSAKSSSCYYNSYTIEIDGEYEGPDWYFFEGSPADRWGPSTYHLESLTHKKKMFEEFVRGFEE